MLDTNFSLRLFVSQHDLFDQIKGPNLLTDFEIRHMHIISTLGVQVGILVLSFPSIPGIRQGTGFGSSPKF